MNAFETQSRIRLTKIAAASGTTSKLPPEFMAKVLGERQSAPHKDLIAGPEGAEDAGVFRIGPERALVFTTDFLPPVVDDPFTFGRIAATQAFSNIYAMGARPIAALNIVSFPREQDPGILAEILAGGASTARDARVAIAGGHSVHDPGIKYGMAVTGEIHPDQVVRNRGLHPNDFLVLTKPLGTGLITGSIRARANGGPEVREAIKWMTTLNAVGLDLIVSAKPHALTDVSGFGFLGHLSEMLGADNLTITIRPRSVPRIPGVERCFDKVCRSSAIATNQGYVKETAGFSLDLGEWERNLLLDGEVSGGLLIALPPSRAEPLVRDLRAAGLPMAAIVGSVDSGPKPSIRVIN